MGSIIEHRDYIEVVPIIKSTRSVRVKSPSHWFDSCEYFSVSKNKDFIKIKKVGLEATKLTKKINRMKPTMEYPHVSFDWVINLPFGKYFIEKEESNEDFIIIYLDTKQ